MSDITLYTFNTGNGAKAAIVLEELGLPYKTEIVDLIANKNKEEWYLKINPNGNIPAITDGSLRVFESGAIMLYLTEKYDKDHKISFPVGSADYYEALSWLMWQMGGLGPMMGQALTFSTMAPVRSDYGIQRFSDEVQRLLGVLEARLKEADYLAGGRYSIADIASFAWVQVAWLMDISTSPFPAIERWVERIKQREAVQKGLAAAVSPMAPEDRLKMFEGMRAKIRAMENSDKH